MQESMRLKPVAGSATLRVSNRDITLASGKYRIPAGTIVWTPIHCIQTIERNWGSEARKFKPVRGTPTVPLY